MRTRLPDLFRDRLDNQESSREVLAYCANRSRVLPDQTLVRTRRVLASDLTKPITRPSRPILALFNYAKIPGYRLIRPTSKDAAQKFRVSHSLNSKFGSSGLTVTYAELFVDALLARLKEQESPLIRIQRIQALKLRRKWRKSDIQRLRQLGMPNWVEPRIRALESSRSVGRGVVKPVQTLEGRIIALLQFAQLSTDPNTQPHTRRQLYKNTTWFREFVEAAYRGELLLLKEQFGSLRSFDREAPYPRRLHEIAEQNVADAASISRPLVRKYCDEVRKTYGETSCPATSAADLKEHLEQGPALLRQYRDSLKAPT